MITWVGPYVNGNEPGPAALKNFAQRPVGTSDPWAKEGRRCARCSRFVNFSIKASFAFYISQQAILYGKLYERHCLSYLAYHKAA